MSRLRVMTFILASATDIGDDGENACALPASVHVRPIMRNAVDNVGFQQCDDGNRETS
jgi:hypothetical protein